MSRWLKLGASGLLVAGALWLRLRDLGYTEIWNDQALTLNMSMEWVRGGALPLASMKSSYGVFNPPMAQYLFALPMFITSNLLGVVWLIALVNLAGIGVLMWATAQVFGKRVAVWAGVLFMVNPWAVYYGRQIWLPSFTPGFAALTYACTLLYFAHAPRWRYALVGALSLAVTIQMHMTAGILIGVLALLAGCFPYRLRFKPLAAGALLFGLTFVPFIVFQFQTHFVDWEALRAGLSRPSETNSASLLILLDLLQAKGIYSTLGTAGGRWQAWDVFGPSVDFIIAALLMVSAAGALIIVSRRLRMVMARQVLPPAVVGHLVNLVWVVVPVLVSVRHNHYLQNYYLLYLLPVALVMMAAFAEEVYRRMGALWPRWAWLSFAPLALVAAQQLALDVHGQNLLVAGASGKERVLDVQQALETAQALLAARPNCQLVVVAESAEYESSRFALFRDFVSPARTRFTQAGSGYLLPEPCAVYFLAAPDMATEAWLTSIARPLPEQTIRTPEETWQFFDLPSESRQSALTRWQADKVLGEWANGLQLRRMEITDDFAPGATVTARGTWALMEAMTPEALHFGQYVLAVGDVVVAQADGPGVDSTQWRLGDVFQTVFSLTLPADLAPGVYTLGVAVYHYPVVENVPLNDGSPLLRLSVFSNLP